MKTEYLKNFSPALSRDMEMKIYGHAGRPVIFIPCQDGRFYDFENFHMTDVWWPWLETGRAMVFSLDTLDAETWSNKTGDPRWRIERHEQWMAYLCDEMVPFMRQMVNERNGWEGYPGVIAFGCSLGATHAANLYFRRPDLFDGLLALSGIYDAAYGFDGYMDDLVYLNSPVHFLNGLSPDHETVRRLKNNRGIICVGLGAWEQPDSTRRVDELCRQKGIPVWVDYWGSDVNHDWPWWHKQVTYFVPFLLEA